jgi:FMN phosphatase YigB (HAD superfamily)
MNKNLIIGLDLDNTLVDSTTNVVYTACRNLGILKQHKKYLKHDWNFSNFPMDLRTEIYRLFRDSNFMNTCYTFNGVVPTLWEWKDKGHRLVIITARAKEIRTGTKKMVKKLFPMIDKLLFVNVNESKTELMKSEKLDVWVDDSLSGVIDSTNLGIKTYLVCNKYTATYNEHVLKESDKIIPIKIISDIKI